MKGIVFNLLERVVTDEHGEDVWEDLLDSAGSEGAYTSVGSYADAEFLQIVERASVKLDVPADDLVRWFGRAAIPHFYERYPHFFTPHTDTRSFVLTLNDVIHPEVRKLFPGADVPTFDFETEDDGLRIAYRSARKLCSFAEGLLEGAAEHYGQTVTIHQPSCAKRGDTACVLECTFSDR